MTTLPLVVVYGAWPRSGTTLLTRVLDAGGAPAIREHIGPHAEDWASGAVLRSPVELLSGITTRHSVKLWRPQIIALLDAGLRPASVVTPARPWKESNASWTGRGWDGDHALGTEHQLGHRWRQVIRKLTAAGVPCHVVEFQDLIDEPLTECADLASLLGGVWDIPAMAAVPDPALRNHGQMSGVHPDVARP